MKRTLSCALFALLAAWSTTASAQGVGGAEPTSGSGPSPGVPQMVESPESTEGEVKQGPNSIKLFDVKRSISSLQLDIGPIWSRRASETTPLSRRSNFKHGAPLAGEIAIGTYYQTPAFRGPFFLTSEQSTALQILDDKSFLWSLFLNKIGGGLKFGPFEIEGKVALHTLSVDIMHAQPSIQLLSPRVEAAIGIHIGRFRVDISGHSEYLWRWFGPDYYVRGVNIGLRFDRVRTKNPYPGASQ